MTKNPFEYRLLAKGDGFVDREEEIETILSTAKAQQNITLYSPRRYGKSSLIMESFRRMDDDTIAIYLDLNKVTSISDMAGRLLSSTMEKSYSTIEKGFSFVKETLLSLRPSFTPKEDGTVSISVNVIDMEEDMERALNFPQKLAQKKDKNMLIAMDEFQRIGTLDGDKLERLFRSVIQEQDRVTYIFSGSQVNMLKEMFEIGDRPFFKSTKIMKLGRIPKKPFKEYILGEFEKSGLEIGSQTVDELLDFTKGHPMRTKQICFEIWNRTYQGEHIEDISAVLDILIDNDIYIEELWNGISTALYRRTLEAVTKSEKPYSHKTIERYDLKSGSHVQRAMKSLERDGILFEEDIVDPFFQEWIRRESG